VRLAGGLDDLGDRIAGADVLVNATSVGMDEPEATPVPADHPRRPRRARRSVRADRDATLREAAAAGATTIDGAWMLLFPRDRGVRNLDRRRRAGGGDERGAAGRVGVTR